MPTTLVLKNAYLSFGGSNISAYVQSVTVKGEYDKVEDKGMGDQVHHNVKGLGNWSIEVECRQSFNAGELDSILWPLFQSDQPQPVVVKPKNEAASTSNPKWTGNGQIFAYPPIQGAVGDGAKTSFTIEPADGTMLTRATSD